MSYEELRCKFKSPPLEYGPIDCWWWEAGVLNKEKMRWQLEEMKRKGIAGTWYYPRFVYGEPLSSDPPFWTEGWWNFLKWSMQEHRRLGMIAWITDWPGHQFFQNKLRKERAENPALTGKRLVIHEKESESPATISIEIPENEEILWAAAYKKIDGRLDESSRRDLNRYIHNHKLIWNAPEAGWLVAVVTSQPYDLDYLNRTVTDRWIEVLLGVIEEKLYDFLGNTLKAYGTDELIVMNGNILFSESLLEKFKKEKGYDPSPYLVGLFHDIGKMTDKIRCDYYDVMVTMLEENLYKRFAEWLHKRGMIYTEFCPNGKWMDILAQTYHYGDFFRYMRHYDIPGNEEDANRTRTFQAKLASSIAHIYGRNRVGLCAYWGSGWGHTTEQNIAWTNENYAYGINLYNRHGVLYSTMGGWYEWVPPAVHFRQPYWQHWRVFTDYIRRLSYILSQGKHVADVAILYPITTIHANWSRGNQFNAVANDVANTTYSLGRLIYQNNIDFDFIDYQSLCRAEVSNGKLKVSGLEFSVLLLPPMTTIRIETLRKIKEFYDGGGVVIAFRRLPSASAENGRDDPYVRSLLKEIFGISSTEEYCHRCVSRCTAHRVLKNENEQGGKAFFVPSEAPKFYLSLPELISSVITPDVVSSEDGVFHTHQRCGELDIYFLFNTKPERRMIEFTFRVAGEPEIWDAFTGEVRPVYRFEPLKGKTKVRLNMEAYQGVVLVFKPPSGRPAVLEDNLTIINRVESTKDGVEVQGYCSTGGKKTAHVLYDGKHYVAEVRVDPPPPPIILNGYWEFHLQPTMDNRWGDFRYPPSSRYIGAEARRFKYMEEGEQPGIELGWHKREFDDSNWPQFTYSFGPYWWTIGPFPEGKEPSILVEEAMSGKINLERRYQVDGQVFKWQWYCFSQKYGCDDVEVHNVWGGLLGVSDKFIVFNATGEDKDVVRYLFTYVHSPKEQELILDFGGRAFFPREAWINGNKVISIGKDEKLSITKVQTQRLHFEERIELEKEATARVHLRKGLNYILLKLVQPKGEKIWTYAVLYDPENPPKEERYVPLLKWFRKPPSITYDILPSDKSHVGWYRFEAPPGLKLMKLNIKARNVQAWVDGESVKVRDRNVTLPSPKKKVSKIALRVEHEPGYYAGAAFPEPIAFECDRGLIPLGDWCDYALESYSGGAIYAKTVKLDANHLKGKIILDLGKVNSTAEVYVNGKPAGVRLGRPYRFDVTGLLQEGENKIEVKIYNTLANHYSIGYPTRYVYKGQTISGLLGPVKLQFLSKVTLSLHQQYEL